jgi:hypothetical protein
MFSPALYQTELQPHEMVELTGFEPATLGL